jgi:hypothetical protein
MNELNDLKYSTLELDQTMLDRKIIDILIKSKIKDKYIKEGNLNIIKAVKHRGYDLQLIDHLESRFLKEYYVPNESSIPKKSIDVESIDLWSYSFEEPKHFKEKNSEIILEDTQHAISCKGCKETGKNTCYDCSGSGSNTCSTCQGRGQNKCSSCQGKGENMCFWCWGKGHKMEGSGADERKVRCSSCAGSGKNPCSNCQNGYIGCETCSSGGKVTCYTCSGSGDITCSTCDGYKTLNHFYKVHVEYGNSKSCFSATDFEENHSEEKLSQSSIGIKKKLQDFKSDEFRKKDFKLIEAASVKSKVEEFFKEYVKSKDSKRRLQSKIEIQEKVIIEIIFQLRSRTFNLYLDSELNLFFFNASHPNDFYKVDLILVAYKRLKEDDAKDAVKLIKEIGGFDGADIGGTDLIAFISNSMELRKAYDFYLDHEYALSEKSFGKVDVSFRVEKSAKYLRSSLYKFYGKESLKLFMLIGIPFAIALLTLLNYDALGFIMIILISSLILPLLLNFGIKSKLFARLMPPLFLMIGATLFYSSFSGKFNTLLSEKALTLRLDFLKNKNDLVVNGNDTLIVLNYTGNEYFHQDIYIKNNVKYRIYQEYTKNTKGDLTGIKAYKSRISQNSQKLLVKDYFSEFDGWRSFESLTTGKPVTVKYADLKIIKEILPRKEIRYIRANIEDLKHNNTLQTYVAAKNIIDHGK